MLSCLDGVIGTTGIQSMLNLHQNIILTEIHCNFMSFYSFYRYASNLNLSVNIVD